MNKKYGKIVNIDTPISVAKNIPGSGTLPISANEVPLSAALTKRELEILRHLATGVPISAIATNLHVSQNTMKTHLKNVYRKIDASGRDEAVAKAKSLYIL